MESNRICPNDGAQLVLKNGAKGQFWACPNYPECRHTENAAKPQIVQPQASSAAKGYHLTPEQVRTNALNAALEYVKTQGLKSTPEEVLRFAELFYPYLVK